MMGVTWANAAKIHCTHFAGTPTNGHFWRRPTAYGCNLRAVHMPCSSRVLPDQLGAPGRAHKASAIISDLRKLPPVEIEYRYRLAPK